MGSLKHMRLWTVRAGLLLAALGAAGAALLSRDAAIGMLIGSLAGILAFWWSARRAEHLMATSPDKLTAHFAMGPFVRYAIYGVALWRCWALDPVGLHGVLAGVVGLFVIQAATVAYAFAAEGRHGQEG